MPWVSWEGEGFRRALTSQSVYEGLRAQERAPTEFPFVLCDLLPFYAQPMGKNSSIEWTDHTFNPWWGCAKVSPACTNCYAEAWSRRVGADIWGAGASRRFFGTKHWQEPLKWNEDAKREGRHKRVFCASMADVFEERPDLHATRRKLWQWIHLTPWLDWLLLTKRPENVGLMVPWKDKWPTNVWLGTSVENQEWVKQRLPLLLTYPAQCRFLSCEPLLGSLDLRAWIESRPAKLYPINWVIAGGESGPGARPMLPGWARNVRDQCQAAGIPFHFKQWGHWAPVSAPKREGPLVRKFWDEVAGMEIFMAAKGKKIAGRRLDGMTWDQLLVTA